jgi:ABC-2 type transport system ATP-binding protein
VISVTDLTRTFGDFTAVKGISFQVSAGAVFGFIGPNGAGKTTTIRILSTLLEPTHGQVSVAGHDVVEEPEKVRAAIGYMPDDFGVYEGVTVQEYLDFFAASYGLSRRVRKRAVADCMQLTDLAKHEKKLVLDLSKGMRQRLCLAKTLVHDPKVLILDEPANGLDPRARIELRELLKELAAMGKTILISSHILTELSDICTDVGIIERGVLLAAGPIAEVSARVQGRPPSGDDALDDAAPKKPEPEVRPLRCMFQFATLSATERAVSILRARPDVVRADARGDREILCDWRGTEPEVWRLVKAIVDQEVALVRLSLDKNDLEALFMAVTKGKVQ